MVAWIRRHKVISMGIAVLLGLCILGGAVRSYNTSTLHNSLSYKDGYSWGQDQAINNNASGWHNGGTAQSFCKIGAQPQSQGGNVPDGDNVGHWIAGCADGENAQIYLNNHPGA